MNLNNFIEYTTSEPITCHGFAAHVQARAIHGTHTAGGARTLLLVLQGRATHVRALWAAFHEKNLIIAEVYVTPIPTIALPQGIQTWIIHHDLTPTHCSHTCKQRGSHFFTFGPPHFGAILAATTAVRQLTFTHTDRQITTLLNRQTSPLALASSSLSPGSK